MLPLKLSKTSWIILIVGVILVAFGSLGFAYFQMSQQQQELEGELAVAENRLANLQLKELTAQKDELDARLKQVTSQLQTAKDDLRRIIESIDVTDTLFDIAAASGVEIVEVTSSGEIEEELAGIDGFVMPLNVRAKGDVPELIDFIIRLNSDFTTGVVKSAQIDIPGASDNTTAETSPIANIRLIVYTYRGS